jgi:flagellar basal-body rod modification protein FlgD
VTVSAVNNATTPQPTTPTTSTAQSSPADLDYNSFLKLLIAQLQNQDPSQPMDSTAFVAQLASFSQVEQSINANSKLDSLLTASGLSIADSVIGRTVTAGDGSASGIVASVKLTSTGPIATLTDGTTVALGSGIQVS